MLEKGSSPGRVVLPSRTVIIPALYHPFLTIAARPSGDIRWLYMDTSVKPLRRQRFDGSKAEVNVNFVNFSVFSFPLCNCAWISME